MLEKRLGKIDFAEFGSMKDYPFQLGLQLGFSMSGNGIMDDSLWYLTRPMRDDEEPETHTFQQSSEFGVFEGTVTIIESVVEGENAS